MAEKPPAAASRTPKGAADSDVDSAKWRTPSELAALTGLPIARLRRLRRRFSCGGSVGSGVAYKVDAYELFASLADAAESPPALIPDGNERRRLMAARAAREELRLAKEAGSQVDVDLVHEAFGAAADAARRGFEAAIRIDPAARQVLETALDDGEAALRHVLHRGAE